MTTRDTPCYFCSLTAAQVALQNPLALFLPDGYPISKGHSLVVPRRHVASFFDCTGDELKAMIELLGEARRYLDGLHAPDGYNVGINVGEAAGQTVMHAHMHLIPRYVGDKSDPRGGVRWIFPDKAAYWLKP